MRYIARAESIAWTSILLATLLLPFFFIPAGWVTIAASKMLLISILGSVAIVAFALASLKEWSLKIPKSSLLAAGALVPLAYLASALATGSSASSFIGGGEQDTLAAAALFYALFVVAANVLPVNGARLTIAIRVFLVGGAVLLLVQLFHLIVPFVTFGGALAAQTGSVLGTWHDLAIGCGLLFFLSLTLLPTAIADDFWRYVLISLAVVSGLFLIITNSGDVWASLALLALLYAGYVWKYGTPDVAAAKQRALVCVVLAVIGGGMYFVGPFIEKALPSFLQVSQLEVRPSWKGTLAIGQQVFSQPGSIFFGSGPNTFPREWGLYKPLSVNQTQFWNVDFYSGVGLIPTTVITLGILGLIAWAAVILALLFSLRRAFRAEPHKGGAKELRMALLGSALFLTALHVLYVPGPALSALTFLLFGFVVADELHTRSIRDITLSLSYGNWRGRIQMAVLSLLALSFLYLGVQTARAVLSGSFVDRAASVYSTTGDLSSASRSISLALAIESSSDRAHRAAVELGMLQLQKLGAAGDSSTAATQQLQETLSRTIQHGLTAVSIENRNYQNWLQLAYLYGQLAGVGVEGADISARSAYAEAQKDNPTSPLPLLGLAQLDLLQKKDSAARDELKAALALKPDLAAAHFLLSQIEARANNLEAATESAAAAAQLAPQDPLGWYNLGTVLYARQDWENAAVSLERATAIQNNYANALFLLGLSYYKLGHNPEALRSFRAVAALTPQDQSLANIVLNLEHNLDPFTATSTSTSAE